MKQYGLLGQKIEYSLSPAMQNAAFKKMAMDAEYGIFDLEPKAADEFLNRLIRSDIQGVNVTVPYKLKAFEFIKKFGTLDKEAEMLGAINTIVVDNGSLFGYNTDVAGFSKSLQVDLKFNPRMKNILICGAGGAGTALAIKLARAAERIFITDTDADKTKAFTEKFFKYYGTEKLSLVPGGDAELEKAVKASQLLINATPSGMKEGEFPVKPEYLHKDISVYDLIYKGNTPLVKAALSMGLNAVNGLGMLLYQGARSFELWTKKRAPITTMKQALMDALAS